MNRDRLRDFMRQIASETYPEPISEGHTFITEEMAPKVAAFIERGAQVLDVGCGQGPALEWFKKAGYYARGITLNREDALACLNKGFHAFLMDQNEMPESFTREFDLVWARHVLEHSVAPFFTLHEFNRVLKPGGVLYVEVPAPDTACQHHTNRNHYSVLGIKMWRSLIERAGFTIETAVAINLVTGAGPDIYFSLICRKQPTLSNP
jgi:SAM-dependent methyltransferase